MAGDMTFQGEDLVIEDPMTFQAFCSRHEANRDPAPRPRPVVDFERSVVVALLLGPQPTDCGPRIVAEQATEEPDRLRIVALEDRLPGTCPGPSSPYHIIEVERRDREPVRVGIGVNTGSLMMGTIGGSERLAHAVLGDSVNVAARIEALTKDHPADFLISGYTRDALTDPDSFPLRLLDRVKLEGRSEPIPIWAVDRGIGPPGRPWRRRFPDAGGPIRERAHRSRSLRPPRTRLRRGPSAFARSPRRRGEIRTGGAGGEEAGHGPAGR